MNGPLEWGDTGEETRRYSEHRSESTISIGEWDDESAVSVAGEHLDDEPGGVSLRATVGGATVSLSFRPEVARALASEIAAAARFADEGDK